MTADTPTIVFVHGAWADASGFAESTRALRERGFAAIGPELSPCGCDIAWPGQILSGGAMNKQSESQVTPGNSPKAQIARSDPRINRANTVPVKAAVVANGFLDGPGDVFDGHIETTGNIVIVSRSSGLV
jgi:hypothetical protein